MAEVASFRLTRNVTADELEDVGERLNAHPALELVLHDVRESRLGAEARLLGLMARARITDKPVNVLLHTGDTYPELRADSRYRTYFSDSVLGALLIQFASSIRRPSGQDHLVELRDLAWRALDEARCTIRRGDLFAAISRDERPLLRASPLLEHLTRHEPAAFEREIEDRVLAGFNLDSLSYLKDLAAFMWQLMENSQEHATSFAGRPIGGARLITVRRYHLETLSDEQLAAGSDQPLRSYLTATKARFGSSPLLEFTVADSGPGVAATMTRSLDVYDGPLADEVAVTRLAFTRDGSCKLARDPDAGGGLPIVMQACQKLRAMAVVRTGRVSLLRDFTRAGEADRDVSDLDLRADRPLPLTGGTSVSIYVPWAEPDIFGASTALT